jgi:hypothetical protein
MASPLPLHISMPHVLQSNFSINHFSLKALLAHEPFLLESTHRYLVISAIESLNDIAYLRKYFTSHNLDAMSDTVQIKATPLKITVFCP